MKRPIADIAVSAAKAAATLLALGLIGMLLNGGICVFDGYYGFVVLCLTYFLVYVPILLIFMWQERS